MKLELKCLRGDGQVRQGPVGRWKRSLGMKNKRRDPSIDSYIPSSRVLQIEEFSVRLTSIHRSSISLFPRPCSVHRLLFLDCHILDKVRGAIALHRSHGCRKFHKSGYLSQILQFVLMFFDIS